MLLLLQLPVVVFPSPIKPTCSSRRRHFSFEMGTCTSIVCLRLEGFPSSQSQSAYLIALPRIFHAAFEFLNLYILSCVVILHIEKMYSKHIRVQVYIKVLS